MPKSLEGWRMVLAFGFLCLMSAMQGREGTMAVDLEAFQWYKVDCYQGRQYKEL